MIGILAYGSLLADTGWEIKEQIDDIIRPVETSFPVEYARKSSSRANAPTLIPVPEGKGIPVQAAVIVLKAGTSLEQGRDILYRREIHQVGKREKCYKTPEASNSKQVRVKELTNFAGLDRVLYTDLDCNFKEILYDTISDFEKAELLSITACNSLTKQTYPTCKDGIAYLDAARSNGIHTRLTGLYVQAILMLAVGAQDLEEARDILARQKGLKA